MSWVKAMTAVALGAASILTGAAIEGHAAGTVSLTFEPYGTFFSRNTRQPIAVDPLVFVQMARVAPGDGPQGIPHAAGLAPAPIEESAASSFLYAADGKPLKVTLGQWVGARGTVAIVPLGRGGQRVIASLKRLIPGGSYSLFRLVLNQHPNTATPLDGNGTANNLRATPDGMAELTLTAPLALSFGQAIVLVYHSDGMPHIMLQGAPGLTAHYQLIARAPAGIQ